MRRGDAARPREVVEADLLDDRAAVPEADEELGVDEGALALERQPLEEAPPDQLAGEVDVADREGEREVDEAVVEERVDRPERPLAGPVVPVPGDDVGSRQLGGAEDAPRLLEVPREVAVAVEDPLLRRGREAGLQRPAEAAVDRVADEPDARLGGGARLGDGGGRVGGGVVDEDDLPVARVPGQRLERDVEKVGKAVLLVPHRDDERDGSGAERAHETKCQFVKSAALRSRSTAETPSQARRSIGRPSQSCAAAKCPG